MAEVTFNREIGAAPEGITRFGQVRTSNGSNVTINNYRSFAGDGSFPLADVYQITYGTTGTATVTLTAEAFAVRGVRDRGDLALRQHAHERLAVHFIIRADDHCPDFHPDRGHHWG